MSFPKVRKFKCWASSGGGCGLGPSREHLISECLFPEKVVHVSGFDWCHGQVQSVGTSGLARQILCRAHNSLLSETDAEAKKAVEIFQRTTPPSPEDLLGDNMVDGYKFERWLLKTAINLSYQGDQHIGVGMAGSEPGKPSPYLVEVAFGRLQFTHQMGAHFLFPDRETQHQPTEIMITPLIKDGHIGGFYFDLRSQAVFLNLFPGHAPGRLGEAASSLPLHEDLLSAKLVYRPPVIATASQGVPISMVRLRW